jgi:hypothetical protein
MDKTRVSKSSFNSKVDTNASLSSGVLQRKCACGQHTAGGGECEECKKKRLQRQEGRGVEPERIPPIVNEVLQSPGAPLSQQVRTQMESRFGQDFSQVRVHTDDRAARSAQAVNALAYTVGQNVVFSAGQYEPTSESGRRLLAHELTHTRQQSRLPGAISNTLTIDSPYSSTEREARAVESRTSNPTDGISSHSSPGLQRAPAPASPAAQPPAREVIAIRLGHRESRGLGRFDTLLYRDCSMKVQFRMNFNFLGPWPDEADKRDWQSRFISSVQDAWSRQHELESVTECQTGCSRVRPFVEIYAPHNNPHVTVDVTYTDTAITSRAGSGAAHLDSQDLTPTNKGDLTAAERSTEGVAPQVPAVHEFGHLIGRRDQYQADNKSCAPGYPLRGVMCFGNEVTEADYEPFANALTEMTGCTYEVATPQVGDFPIPSKTEMIA